MYLFVINEHSGGGGGRHIWDYIERILVQRGISYQYIFSKSAEEAQSFLSTRLKSKDRYKAVGVVGGDGTVHSILPALRGTGVPFSVIPAGSGNDTARGLNIPKHTLAALEVLLSGTPSLTDLITIPGHSTLTALAIGFDAEVAHNVNNSFYKKVCNFLRMGRVAYIIGVIHTLIKFQPAKLTVTIDKDVHIYDSAWMTSINNVTSYGGGLMICPQAITDDGLLDICIVHDCSRFKLLFLFPLVLTGKHVDLPYVTIKRGTHISVHSEATRLVIGDGELIATTPISASVETGALLVMRLNEESN